MPAGLGVGDLWRDDLDQGLELRPGHCLAFARRQRDAVVDASSDVAPTDVGLAAGLVIIAITQSAALVPSGRSGQFVGWALDGIIAPAALRVRSFALALALHLLGSVADPTKILRDGLHQIPRAIIESLTVPQTALCAPASVHIVHSHLFPALLPASRVGCGR